MREFFCGNVTSSYAGNDSLTRADVTGHNLNKVNSSIKNVCQFVQAVQNDKKKMSVLHNEL